MIEVEGTRQFLKNCTPASRAALFTVACTARSVRGAWGGKGTTDGLFDCCHGLAVDTRYDQPLLLVCDRENRRLCHLDLDGKFVGTVTQHLRRTCQVSFQGDYAVVSELEGRASILDKDNAPVAFLGDNPKKTQWANYQLQPNEIGAAFFSAAHGCHIDQHLSESREIKASYQGMSLRPAARQLPGGAR
jgi:hypothetical protein